MKKFLPLLFAVIALPLFQSCVGPGYYGSSYGTATNYGSSVGIIATSHSRWGYDPYYRSYYDYSLGQYYDLNRGRYYTSLPTRYNSPYYPSYYRRGTALRCPNNLPYLNTRFTRPSVTFASTSNSRWAYDPYRRSYYDNQRKRYYNTSSGSYYNSLPKRHSSPSYPRGHRSGQKVQLNPRLPYVSNRTSSQPTRSYRPSTNQRPTQGTSNNRSQRPTQRTSNNPFQRPTSGNSSYRNQRPTVGNSSYRNRSSGNNQPSSSQRNRPSSGNATRGPSTTQRTQNRPQPTQRRPQQTQSRPQPSQTRGNSSQNRSQPSRSRTQPYRSQPQSNQNRGRSSNSSLNQKQKMQEALRQIF